MAQARITVDPAYRVSKIEQDLYGCFLEPIRTWVYGGIYNPDHPTADDMGFRGDMLNAVRELGIPAVRFPGGNFVSGWDWRDSVGPMSERKAHLDLAWRQIEPNIVGHNEYMEWVKRAGARAMYTLNTGTGTMQSAMDCVEYSTIDRGTYLSDLRRAHGYDKPWNVATWYMGNEQDGPWQINSWHKDPKGYGIFCRELGKIIRWIDSKAKIGVCGSSSPLLHHHPEWERKVLEECYDAVDLMSIHYYHNAPAGDWENIFAGTAKFEEFLNTELAAADYARALVGSRKPLMISFDEYSIAQLSGDPYVTPAMRGNMPHGAYMELTPEHMTRPFKQYGPDDMGPRRSGGTPIVDAINLASLLLLFIRRADRVKVACMTGGMGAAIGYDRDHVWKNPAYFPYQDLIRYGRGTSILPAVDGPTFNSKGYAFSDFYQAAPYEDVPMIESAAAYDEEEGTMNVFLVNRSWDGAIDTAVTVPGFKKTELLSATTLYADDIHDGNSYGCEKVAPRPLAVKQDGESWILSAPGFSWTTLRFKVMK